MAESGLSIRWLLHEDEPLKTFSLVGSFELGLGRLSVVIPNTYVDSWLATLVDVVSRAKGHRNAEGEIEEEPVKLNLRRWRSRATLEINSISVNLPWRALEEEVQRAARQFATFVRRKATGPDNPKVQAIEEFGRRGLRQS